MATLYTPTQTPGSTDAETDTPSLLVAWRDEPASADLVMPGEVSALEEDDRAARTKLLDVLVETAPDVTAGQTEPPSSDTEPEAASEPLELTYAAPALLVSAADHDVPILEITKEDASSLVENTDESPEIVWKKARFGMVSLALPAQAPFERERGLRARHQFRLIGVSLAAMFIAVAVAYGIGGPEALLNLGYFGVFLSALISSASMVIPVPLGPAAIALGILLDTPFNMPAFLLVGVVGGTGSAIGELTGFMAGKAGSCKLTETRFGGYITRQMQRHGKLAVFAFAVVPNPFLDVVGIAAGCGGMSVQTS